MNDQIHRAQVRREAIEEAARAVEGLIVITYNELARRKVAAKLVRRLLESNERPTT